MKATLALAGLVLCLLPSAVLAAPTHQAAPTQKAAATTYQCSKCHMIYTAAQAKQDHYKDPMDGGTLVPVAPKKAAPKR
jgi:hypothetical protein